MLEITPKAAENKAEELITTLCKSLVHLSAVYSSSSFVWICGTRKCMYAAERIYAEVWEYIHVRR